MAITGHNITMSKRTWARLPKDIQQVFREQSAKTAQDYLAWVGDFEAKAAANMKSQGATFKPFPAAELKKWRSSAPDFLAQWEKDTAAATKDAAMPKKVAARWRQLLAK
jgi:TRAP-type C4-dicarboxylate transport system substrate-binding protein